MQWRQSCWPFPSAAAPARRRRAGAGIIPRSITSNVSWKASGDSRRKRNPWGDKSFRGYSLVIQVRCPQIIRLFPLRMTIRCRYVRDCNCMDDSAHPVPYRLSRNRKSPCKDYPAGFFHFRSFSGKKEKNPLASGIACDVTSYSRMAVERRFGAVLQCIAWEMAQLCRHSPDSTVISGPS